MTSSRKILKSIEGKSVPGGCECCDAFQYLSEVADGIWALEVAHDDDCPFVRSRARTAEERSDSNRIGSDQLGQCETT
jgi:hypothetical protein